MGIGVSCQNRPIYRLGISRVYQLLLRIVIKKKRFCLLLNFFAKMLDFMTKSDIIRIHTANADRRE